MRYLVCLDPQPAADGTCAQQAWVEVADMRDLLPTVDQAQAVGNAVLIAIGTVAAMSLLLPSRSSPEE